MTTSEIVIETRKLTKVYGDGTAVYALNDVDLIIYRGEYIVIIGPSGSGKSTLLNMLGTLDKPSSGDIIINNVPLSEVRDIDRFRSRTIGFVFQTHNLIPTLTARENVEVPMVETTWRRAKRHARAQELLELVGLSHRLNHLPNQLSGGERQRVAIARALANDPAIILADEPTGNLDSKNSEEIINLLQTLNRTQQTTLLIVTHDLEIAATAPRVVTFLDGKILSDETRDQASHADPEFERVPL